MTAGRPLLRSIHWRSTQFPSRINDLRCFPGGRSRRPRSGRGCGANGGRAGLALDRLRTRRGGCCVDLVAKSPIPAARRRRARSSRAVAHGEGPATRAAAPCRDRHTGGFCERSGPLCLGRRLSPTRRGGLGPAVALRRSRHVRLRASGAAASPERFGGLKGWVRGTSRSAPRNPSGSSAVAPCASCRRPTAALHAESAQR